LPGCSGARLKDQQDVAKVSTALRVVLQLQAVKA
jgi:hypothetical protein